MVVPEVKTELEKQKKHFVVFLQFPYFPYFISVQDSSNSALSGTALKEKYEFSKVFKIQRSTVTTVATNPVERSWDYENPYILFLVQYSAN